MFLDNQSVLSYFSPMLTPSLCNCKTMLVRRFHWLIALADLGPSNPMVASSQPSRKVAQPSGPAIVEAVESPPAVADVLPVIASAKEKFTAPVEDNISALVGMGATAPEVAPLAEPKATTETSVHPQDVDLGIPPQVVSSTYVRISISLYSSYVFFLEF